MSVYVFRMFPWIAALKVSTYRAEAAAGDGMLSYRIIAMQVVCLAGAVLAGLVLHGPNMVTVILGAAVVGLQVLQRHQMARHQRAVFDTAVAEWHREFRERMEIELARGITATQAEFLVRPVMEARQFWTYEDAMAYLAGRVPQATIADGMEVLPPEDGGRQG